MLYLRPAWWSFSSLPYATCQHTHGWQSSSLHFSWWHRSGMWCIHGFPSLAMQWPRQIPLPQMSITHPDHSDKPRSTLPYNNSTCVTWKQHTHSQSLSLGSNDIATAECAKSFDVLKAVQQHMHLYHAFAGSHHPQHVLEDVELASHPPTPHLTCCNSLASTISVPGVLDDVPPSPCPTVSIDPTDPAQPQGYSWTFDFLVNFSAGWKGTNGRHQELYQVSHWEGPKELKMDSTGQADGDWCSHRKHWWDISQQ